MQEEEESQAKAKKLGKKVKGFRGHQQQTWVWVKTKEGRVAEQGGREGKTRVHFM